ncbi:MAG: OPT family oligopeptide transporter [Candidatus Rifleibacteriota bacterium]
MSNKTGLSPKAYEVCDGKDYPSFVPASQSPAEFTFKAIVIGMLIGSVFGAANAYLGLKVGLTVSASIPAAVMAVAIFRIFFKKGTILETNMVQTVGSAGESLAAGVIFTIPALFIWGMEPTKLEITVIAIIGGLIGVLFMIPLRKYLIVQEHGKLPYPEGTACAEVLVAGQGDLSKAKTLFKGMGIGALYQALMHNRLFGLWSKEPTTHIPGFKGAEVGAEVTPELLGVGYIIGPKISAIMLSGGMMGWLVLIPLIYLFGDQLGTPIYPETAALIKDMAPIEIWSRYIRYIGAGGVAFAGIFSLIKSIPVILTSFKAGFSSLGKSSNTENEKRTQTDLPLKVILIGSAALVLLITIVLKGDIFPSYATSISAAFLIVLFGFFFVTVSSRIVGLLGSSSNPISGMTIATLLLTCLIFILAGMAGMPNVKVAVLTVGAFVCIAAAIAGDTSQDLKTGFLIGATPKHQQIGEFFGVIASGLTMGFVMYLLKDAITTGELPAPQANLMKLVIDGVIGGSLPWNLVFCGVFIAIGIELLGINSLAFAVGLYLPMSLSVPIMAGGIIRWILELRKKDPKLEQKRETGVLYSSGLIAGAALTGVLIMVLLGFAEKSPGMLSGISKPGVHVINEKVELQEINGESVKGDYYKVAPDLFPDNSATVASITSNRVELRKLKSAPDADEQAIAALDRKVIALNKALNKAKRRELQIKCLVDGKMVQKTLTLGKWQKLYLTADKSGLKVRTTPENHDFYAVIAFLLLCASLAYFVMRKPDKDEVAENGD